MSKNKIETESIILTLEEIKEIVEAEADDMGSEKTVDLILSILRNNSPEEQELFKNEPPMVQMLYLSKESYIRGFMNALYIFNESLKIQLSEKGVING